MSTAVSPNNAKIAFRGRAKGQKMAKKAHKSAKDAPSACGPVSDPKWQAEDDVRTLERAEEVESDPGRMKRAAVVAKEKAKAMNSVVNSLVKRGLISDRERDRLDSKRNAPR